MPTWTQSTRISFVGGWKLSGMDTSTPLMASLSPSLLDNVLLSDDSGSIKYRGKQAVMTLSAQYLTIKSQKSSSTLAEIQLNSVIGVACKSKLAYKETYFSVELYTYVISNGCCSNSKKHGNHRKRVQVSIDFSKNESLCRKWTNAISSVLAGVMPLLVADNGFDILPPAKQRHLLVFVNPVSGKGLGKKIWEREVRPLIEEADIRVQLVVTQYANHAKALLLEQDLSPFDGVVIVGGDGLIFEVINGIGARPDFASVFASLPIIPIPGGTANGLVKSVLHECGEEYSAMNATFVAIKGRPQPFDLSRVVTQSGTVHYSFLILGWGLISDIDILSETMRCIGELRLYLAAVYFIMKKRKYKGRLRMQLANPDRGGGESPRSSSDNLADRSAVAPYQGGDLESGGQPSGGEGDWISMEGEFVLVWVVQTSHATASMHSGPGASLSDGVFTIFVVRDMNRFELLQMLIAADDGGHIKHPRVKTYKAVAYSLEPLTEKGIFTLDGEVVEYGMLRATMLPGAAKVMSLN